MIDLVITSIQAEAGAPLQVTVAQRHFPPTATLSWSPVAPGFAAAVEEAHRRRTVLLVDDGFFELPAAAQRWVFVRALARLIRLHNQPAPWVRALS